MTKITFFAAGSEGFMSARPDHSTSVLLAENDPQVRSALHLLLEQESAPFSIDEVLDAEAMLDKIQLIRSSATPADLLIIDWHLPGFSPLQQLPALRQCCPGIKVVALCVHRDERQAALDTGADAFISKSDPPEQVIAALHNLLDD